MSELTPSQTVGPFYAYGLTPEGRKKWKPGNVYKWKETVGDNLVTPDAEGERIRIEGVISDGDGKPITDAMLEIWQADAQGRYADPRNGKALPNVKFKMICEGQIQGGLAQGIGQALMEDVVYDRDSGQLLTGSYMDYAMPRAGDMGALTTAFSNVPCRTNPLGIKGVGESGAIGAPPAVMNAVADALRPVGADHLDMPATPFRVWRAIGSAAAGG